jgi:DHA2 family multidrug resistance protein
MLVLGLELGQRMNWFESSMIRVFIVGGLGLLVLFFINEWSHPLPFFKLQLLKIRNLAHALITLGGVLFVLLAVIKIPSAYLAQIQGYRPLDTAPVMLLVAVPQLIALPLVVALCNLRRVDCRWVLAIGLALLALACGLGSQVTSVWNRDNFYALQAIQIIAQPMAVIPLLMLATGSLNPADGPFASAWFNTVKGFAAMAAGSLLQVLTVNREHFHSMMLVDRLGNSPWVSDSADLAHRVHQQAMVLTSSDLYLCMAGLAVLLIVLIPFGPTRIYPPRAAR